MLEITVDMDDQVIWTFYQASVRIKWAGSIKIGERGADCNPTMKQKYPVFPENRQPPPNTSKV